MAKIRKYINIPSEWVEEAVEIGKSIIESDLKANYRYTLPRGDKLLNKLLALAIKIGLPHIRSMDYREVKSRLDELERAG